GPQHAVQRMIERVRCQGGTVEIHSTMAVDLEIEKTGGPHCQPLEWPRTAAVMPRIVPIPNVNLSPGIAPLYRRHGHRTHRCRLGPRHNCLHWYRIASFRTINLPLGRAFMTRLYHSQTPGTVTSSIP